MESDDWAMWGLGPGTHSAPFAFFFAIVLAGWLVFYWHYIGYRF